MKNSQRHICFGIILLINMSISMHVLSAEKVLKKIKYHYLLSLPQNYYLEPLKKWPVIFYLHGSRASGNNLKRIEQYGLPYYLSSGKKIDFIVVSPQCPEGKDWTTDDWFNPVYDEIAAKYRVDDCRLYLVGMSMGGFGTWALANRMPNRFAAISPMCGGGDAKWAFNLSRLPIWVFHGSEDTIVPAKRSKIMVEALKMINNQLKFSLLIKRGHDISEQFNNDELYAWLRQFSLKKISFWEEPLPFLKTLDKIKNVTHSPAEQIAFSHDITPLRIQKQ